MTHAQQTRGLLHYAQIRLYYADEAEGHQRAREETADAADALHAAAMLATEPHCTTLFRLQTRLNDALDDGIGHPAGDALQAVADGIGEILEHLTEE